MLSEFVSVAVLVEFQNKNIFGSAYLNEDHSISSLSAWVNNTWVDAREHFESNSALLVKVVPSIKNEKDVMFIYVPASDKGRRK